MTKIKAAPDKIGWGDKVKFKDYKTLGIVTDVGLEPNCKYDFIIENSNGDTRMVKLPDLKLVRKNNRGQI